MARNGATDEIYYFNFATGESRVVLSALGTYFAVVIGV